jgi:isoamylase
MLRAFTRAAIGFRRSHRVLRRTRWLDGSLTARCERDVDLICRDCTEMTRERWEDPTNRCFCFQLGRATPEEAAILVLINGEDREAAFVLPPAPAGLWTVVLDSAVLDSAVLDPAIVGPRALRAFASGITGQ